MMICLLASYSVKEAEEEEEEEEMMQDEALPLHLSKGLGDKVELSYERRQLMKLFGRVTRVY